MQTMRLLPACKNFMWCQHRENGDWWNSDFLPIWIRQSKATQVLIPLIEVSPTRNGCIFWSFSAEIWPLGNTRPQSDYQPQLAAKQQSQPRSFQENCPRFAPGQRPLVTGNAFWFLGSMQVWLLDWCSWKRIADLRPENSEESGLNWLWHTAISLC